MKEKPVAGSPFFGAFPSDRLLKATNDVSVHFFPYAAIPVNCTSELRVIFEVTTCKDTRCVFVINKTLRIFRHFQSLVVSLVHQASRSCSVSKQVRVKGRLRLRVSSVLVSSLSWGSWPDSILLTLNLWRPDLLEFGSDRFLCRLYVFTYTNISS